MPEIRRVGVIGGGLSGIATIKQLREEGHQVTCFEKGSEIGGVFSNDGAYDSTLLTISNYFMAYSDFSPKGERLKFWTRREYNQYLHRYIDHFGLGDSIQLDSTVERIERRGKDWCVRVVSKGEAVEHLFDAVAVCSGMFQFPKIPDLPGLKDFEGRVVHSKDYKNALPFEGRRVLCVGLGESSADMTSEISEVAESCYLSLRRYPVVAPRYIPFQRDQYYTIDASWITSRIINYLPTWAHISLVSGYFRDYLKSVNPDVRYRGQWDLKAGPSPHQVITKNERVYTHIVDGQVKPNVSGIHHIGPDFVEFGDGEKAKIDTILFCTGFETRFPFLPLNFSSTRELYKQMFHPDADQSLAFIGFVRPQQGGIPAIAELQARYFTQLCSGEKQIPDPETRRAIAEHEKEYWEHEYYITPHVSSLVNYCTYMDSMADLVGCKPEIPPFFSDPELHLKLWFGPQFSAQYRLNGPHANRKEAEAFVRAFPLVFPKTKIAYLLLLRTLSTWFPEHEKLKPRLIGEPARTA